LQRREEFLLLLFGIQNIAVFKSNLHMKRNSIISPHARHLFTVVAAVSFCSFRTSPAQEGKPVQQNAPADSIIIEPSISDTTKSARVFLDRIEVFGTVAKPQALFILPGTDPTVDGLTIDRSFFKEIFRPVGWAEFKKKSQPSRTRLRW